MIEVRELTKRYRDRLAVDSLTFTVRPGRVTGFLGPNGAGKSTTMRLILGLDRPTGGRVLLDGHPYAGLAAPLTRIGALLEASAAQGGRIARDHLLWLARSNRIPRRRVDEVLAAVGLQDVAAKRSGGFSLGMGQRLGIAAALLGDPPVVMLDEPVNGLDPEGVLWIRNLMKSLAAEGRTVFVSSHLMSEMALTADHLVVIGRGRLLADVPTEEFIDRNARAFVRVRTGQQQGLLDALAEQDITARRTADGAWEVEDAEPAVVAALAARHGVVLEELSRQRASLEEAFMRMTAQEVEYRPTADGSGPAHVPHGAPTPSATHQGGTR